MDLSSPAALLGFRTRFETQYNQAWNLTEPIYDRVAMVFPAGNVAQVTHRWLKGLKMPREFIGKRKHNNVDTAGFTIRNKPWENTIDLLREDIERDPFGIFDPLVPRLAQVTKLHRDKLVFELLSDALTDTSITAYDGIAFYGVHTRTAPGVTFTNKVSAALSESSVQNALSTLAGARDSEGNPLMIAGGKPTLLIRKGSNLIWTAKKLANMSFTVQTAPGSGASSASNQAASGENILQATFDILECPFLKTNTEWHMVLGEPIARPIIFQVEKEVEMLQPPMNFMKEWEDEAKWVIGTYARYNVGVGLPEAAYASTGA